ncbi:MAG: protein phosphatase 2C domain-containing protein [Bryobacteraceae bacterium]
MTYAAGNAQHIGARTSQQDSFGFTSLADAEFVRHGGLLAVLADGMGGMAHGDAASRAAVHAFLTAYRAKTADEPPAAALARALDDANAAVCELAEQLGARGETGTTLIGAVLLGDTLEWVSVGDSGLFLFHDEAFVRLNEFHTHARDLDAQVAAGLVAAEVAAADPQRDALTSFVGMGALAHVDRSLRPLPLDPGDSILLASDGLFKVISAGEMTQAMHGNLQQRCDGLVEAVTAKRAPQQDNVTVLMLGTVAEVPAPLALPKTEVMAALPPPRRSRATWAIAVALLAALAVAGYALRDRWISPAPVVTKAPTVPTSEKATEKATTGKDAAK